MGSGAPEDASTPPALPGLDPRWSSVVETPDPVGGGTVRWHVLDTASALRELGVEPIGTILCVHGNPTWSYLWRAIAAESVDRARSGRPGWRVVAPDQLEMGFSARSGRARRLADRVRDLGALTDELGLEGPVVTLGHDWGGVVSMGWAVDHPELLAGLTLLNTAIAHPDGEPIPAPLRLAVTRGVLPLVTARTTAFLDTTLALARPALEREVADAYRAPYRAAARREGIAGFVRDIPADSSHESAPELHRIAEGVREVGVPALLLWGPRDPIFSDRYLDDLVERLPQADVHRFEGAGHLIAEEVDYAGAVLDWLDDRGIVGRGGHVRAGTAVEAEPVVSRPSADEDPARRPLWAELDERRTSDEVALVELAPPGGRAPRSISWSLLSRRVDELAAGLSRFGVRAGDRVSLLVPPGADLTAALYACVRIGAVVVVADAGLGLAGLTRAVRGAVPDFIIGARPGLAAARALRWPGRRISTTTLPAPVRAALGVEASLPELARTGADRALPPVPDSAAVAAVLFTSGSTGPAKGVVYTHGQLESLRNVLARSYGITRATGLVAGFAPFALLGPALGARVASPDMDVTAPRTLTARAVADAVAAVRATVLFLSPAAIANVVATAGELTAAQREALARVELVLSAGAPVSAALLEKLVEMMPNASAHTPYGMTEGLLMTDVTLEGIREAASDAADEGVCVGQPAEGVLVRIAALDALGRATGEPSDAPGVTGEIVLSAPHLKTGYDRLWLTDRAAVRNTDGAGGRRWHRTGDVGHLDGRGRLWVEGRLPHVIATADGPVTPVGVEQRIERVPGVGRVGVAAVGPAGVQQVVAVLEPVDPPRRAALADDELARRAREVAGVPLAAVLTVPRLPTDIRHNSKIDRTRLSRWAENVLAGGRMGAP